MKKLLLLFFVLILLVPITFAQVNFSTNMKACWKADTGTFTDEFGNFDGTIVNAQCEATYGGGFGGGACHFTNDGSIAVGGVGNDFNFAHNVSMLIIINVSNIAESEAVFSHFDDSFLGGQISISGTSHRLGFTGANLDFVASSGIIDDGTIHTIVFTWNTSSEKGILYVDGIVNSTGTGAIAAKTAQTYFGRSKTPFYDGTIGGPAAYWENRTLSAIEVSVLETNLKNGEVCDADTPLAPIAHTEPASMLLINLTSEAGATSLGQIIFQEGVTDRKLTNPVKTNDTTPVIKATTNITATCALIDWNLDFNYTDAIAYNPNAKCEITGGLNHICTLTNDNATEIGLHNFSIGCKNGGENLTSTSGKFTINITDPGFDILVKLDGLNDSRKYEYRSIANISAQIPEFEQVCIDLDAPNYGFNYSCGIKTTSFLFNITILRIRNWSHGPSKDIRVGSGTFNVTSDNKTVMQAVSFNVSSTGTTTNLNITYYGKSKIFQGDLKTVYLEFNKFIHSNTLKDAVNLTYLTAGSNFIFSNLTNVDNPINITFQLTGFNLDAENEFSYTEHFNGTDGSSGFNETLTYQVDAPLGVFDDFVTNVSGRWNADDASSCTPVLSYSSDGHGSYIELSDGGNPGGGCDTLYLDYDGEEADFRNSSRIEIDFARVGSCFRGINVDCTSSDYLYYFYATDGTSQVQLDGDYHVQCSGNPSSSSVNVITNYTLIKKSDDYKTWELFLNGSSKGIKDLSSLDFTKQIKFRHRPQWSAGTSSFPGDCSASAGVRQYEVKVSGGWLNRSTNNGTYKPTGNITSKCLTTTTTNISKATLIWTPYEPDGTNIKGYVSNICNATLPVFEIVTSGIEHTFNTVGNEPSVRFVLNSSINITSPIVRKYTFDIISSRVENVTVELDGVNVHTFIGELNNTITFVNLTPTPNQLNTIKISSATAGLIQVDNFKVNSSINPISLNETVFEDCSNCIINFTFSGNDLEVSGLEWDFLGSWNFTATARFGTLSISQIVQVFYSDFNVSLPFGTDWWDVFPGSKDAKNVTPFSQTSSTPIWNVSNLAYDEEIDVYVKTNETLNSCSNITESNNSFSIESVFNESFVWINGTAIQLANSNLVNGSGVVFNQTPVPTTLASNTTIFFDGGEDWTLDTNCPADTGWTSCSVVDGANTFIQSLDSSSVPSGTILSEDRVIGMWDIDASDMPGTFLKLNNNTTGFDKVWITFFTSSGDSNDAGEGCWINISTDDSDYTNIFDSEDEGWLDGKWYNKSIDITSFQSATTWIRLGGQPTFTRGAGHEWCDWDNFTLIGETAAVGGANEIIDSSNYEIDYADGTITLNTSFGDRQQFGINYSFFVHRYDLNQDFTFRLNTSYQKILENISVDFVTHPNKRIWNWVDLTNCTAGIEIPWFFFASICTDCYFDITQLDLFNLIET